MAVKDLKIGVTTNDLEFTNFDLSFVEEVDYVVQKLKIRLQFFLGEWFLDTSVGTPYFQEIFIKNPDVAAIESIFRAIILETNEVNELLSFVSDYDNSLRKFSLVFSVNTTFGLAENVEVTI